jgi:broad specificity phosphatase PhoE
MSTIPSKQHRELVGRTGRLVLVRHSLPQIDENVPSSQWHLSESGRVAATVLAGKLKARDFTFTRIASSPEPKALQTAQVILSAIGSSAAVDVDDSLSEHRRNHVGFLPQKEFEGGIERLFISDLNELVFGEETANAALERFEGAVQRLTQSSAGDLMIVTHGTVLSLYAKWRFGLDALSFWKALKAPTAVVIDDYNVEVIPIVTVFV